MNTNKLMINNFLIALVLFFNLNCGWAGFGNQAEKDKKKEENLLILGGLFSFLSSTSAAPANVSDLTATINPSDLATNVSVSTGISITFNRAVNASTIHSSTVYLMQGTTTISGSLTVVGANAAVFIPASPLSYNTAYTITVTTGVTDTLGPPRSLTANITSSFTTQTDSSLPTVTLVSPSTSATDVSTNANIFITFSKPMAAATLNTTNITLTNGVTLVTGTISTFGTSGVYFIPSSTLANSTSYTINILTGVTDLSGVALASSYSSTFTTIATTTIATPDTTPPTVTATNPSNSATSVAISQTILITFNKPITSSTINSTNITLTQGSTSIAGSVNAVGTNGAIFQPTSSLAYNTLYTLTLRTGITDTATTPNALANTTISFTTLVDIAPTVSFVSPANSSTNILKPKWFSDILG